MNTTREEPKKGAFSGPTALTKDIASIWRNACFDLLVKEEAIEARIGRNQDCTIAAKCACTVAAAPAEIPAFWSQSHLASATAPSNSMHEGTRRAHCLKVQLQRPVTFIRSSFPPLQCKKWPLAPRNRAVVVARSVPRKEPNYRISLRVGGQPQGGILSVVQRL